MSSLRACQKRQTNSGESQTVVERVRVIKRRDDVFNKKRLCFLNGHTQKSSARWLSSPLTEALASGLRFRKFRGVLHHAEVSCHSLSMWR